MENTVKDQEPLLFTLIPQKLTTIKEPINFNAHVGEMILDAFKYKPDFIGQIDANTEQQTTFQEMREKSVKCALWLKKNDISSRNVVAICARNEINVYVPFLACLYINAIAYVWNNVFFDCNKPLCLIWRTDPDVIFIQECYVSQLCKAVKMLPNYAKLLSKKKIVVFGDTKVFTSFESIMCTSVSVKEIDEFSCTRCILRETAMILYTTNNYGYMDEIQFSYISFISPSNQYPPGMSFGDVGLWCEPFSWIYSPLLTVRAILSLVTTIKTLTTTNNMTTIFHLIEKYKVTWIFLKYNISLEIEHIDDIVERYNISSLKQFVYICPNIKIIEIIPKQTLLLPKSVTCIRVYGTAETGIIASEHNNGEKHSKNRFSYISRNIEIVVVDCKTRAMIPPWQFGELWCKSPCMMSTNNKSAKIIFGLENHISEWFFTGDIGHIEDGVIHIYDKANRVLIYNGFYSEFELQLMLKTNPNVSNVIVQFSSTIDHAPVIYVWTKPNGEKVTEEELRNLMRPFVDSVLINRILIRIVIDDLPLYPDGEINQRKVRSVEYVRNRQLFRVSKR